MITIKKILTAALAVSVAAVSSGCAQTSIGSSAETIPENIIDSGKENKLSIVCTVFPGYDWVREILGEKAADADLTYLLGSGADMHSYQPSAEDILKISDCDMFVYVGGESDGWTESVLGQSDNSGMKVVNLMEIIGDSAKSEELKEGMQESCDEDHEHDHEDEDHEHEHHEDEDHEHEHHHDEDEPEYDEHVWLSLKNAEIFCGEIANDLCELDPENSETYKANLAAYTEKLDALDRSFEELFAGSSENTLIFCDRFPFRYFVDDYGIDYYAAFLGCSAETEASFETVIFLAGKLDELGNDTVYIIENSDGKIARSVIDASADKERSIAILDSVQSVSGNDIAEGKTYLGAMQSNYDVLKNDLG